LRQAVEFLHLFAGKCSLVFARYVVVTLRHICAFIADFAVKKKKINRSVLQSLVSRLHQRLKPTMPVRFDSSATTRSHFLPKQDPMRPMFKYQAGIPMLPVPALEETCERYLKTVHPLAASEEELQRTRKAVATFLASPQSKELQKRLEARRDQV
jgi:hypothetical protein